ncbi:MAG: sensor histidine kinase [Lachnospiraceae bacterium]
MDNRIFLKYLCLPIASFGMMTGVFYSGINFSSSVWLRILMTVCYILMLFGNIIIFYAFNQYSEEMNSNMENQALIMKQQADLEYFMQMSENQERHNEFIHNISHYLRTIHQFAQEDDCKRIVKIVSELDSQLVESEMKMYSNYHVLNAILSEKRRQAEKMSVEFDVYVEPGIVLDRVEDIDLIAMLGNLLDNALQAAENNNKKSFVKVRIYMQDMGGFCVVKIVNSYFGNVIVHEDTFVSTKNEKGLHGLGIKSVNRMAEKYGGYLSCKAKEDVFEAVLLISTI